MERWAASLGLTSDRLLLGDRSPLAAMEYAATYLAFFAATLGLHGLNLQRAFAGLPLSFLRSGHELIAISLGAAPGALTYIGNAPNMLIKSIAEHAGVPTPTFVGYIWKFALPILLPICDADLGPVFLALMVARYHA